MTYRPSSLYKYIQGSELRVVNDGFRVRLSPELARKFDAGIYKTGIDRIVQDITEINALGITYPGKANPVFYMYIVPDDNFIDLLSFPYKEAKRGGRPVSSFDLDGFNAAYGQSQNSLELANVRAETIAQKVNMIHEFAHLVHGQFFIKNQFLNEGVAEVLPLYTLGYEEKFDEHRAVIADMTADDIFSPQQLILMERNKTFGHATHVENKTCSFDWAYISSYLFVRGYITQIAKKFNLNRVAATQKFLELGRASQCTGEWMILDLASYIGLDGEQLLDGKELQLMAQEDISAL